MASPLFQWIPFKRGDPLPPGVVLAGKTSTDGEVYVGRSDRGVGKLNLNNGTMRDLWVDGGGATQSGEVLVIPPGTPFDWISAKKGDDIPCEALIGGQSSIHGLVYICRSKDGEVGNLRVKNGRLHKMHYHGHWTAKEDGQILCVDGASAVQAHYRPKGETASPSLNGERRPPLISFEWMYADCDPYGIWEYQRYWPGIDWLRPGLIGAGDPPPYCDDDCEKTDPPPDSWQIIKSGGTDVEGWEYASNYSKLGTSRQHGRGVMSPNDRLRRRRWEPGGGTSQDEVIRVIAERRERKTDALTGVGRQMSALIKSRSIARNLDLLSPVSWANLRKQHLAEYQDFLEGLPPAEFGPEHQFGLEEGQRVSLHPVSTIVYAFRFMMAAYGSAFIVDAETQRRKMLQLAGLPDEALLQIKEEGETLRPAYALFLDHSERRCVLAIRGTATIEDALTDTVADPVFDESLNGYVHGGIRDAAHWVLGKVAEVMKIAAVAHPEYTLMITGHSLGAGVAALATLLLERQEPQNCGFHAMHGIGFATPGVATLAIAEGPSAMQCFTTLVCARDGIVRTCVPNIYVMQHEVAMAGTRTRSLDKVGKVLSGPLQNYAERRHKEGAEAAEQLSGPKCFPVGPCIVLADPGETNARALVAMPSSISKMFVHEEMASDHATDRYALGLQCLGWAPVPEGSSLFFGAMAHEDWSEVDGQLFATETEARLRYGTFSLLTASMVVNPLGEVIAYHGSTDNSLDKEREKSRKKEMSEWYRKACKNEVCENNGPYTCMQHIQFGQVEGWSFDSVKDARKKFKSLTSMKACMIVDKRGSEVVFYGLDCSSMDFWASAPSTAEVISVREDMLRWFGANIATVTIPTLLQEGTCEDSVFAQVEEGALNDEGSFHSCYGDFEQR